MVFILNRFSGPPGDPSSRNAVRLVVGGVPVLVEVLRIRVRGRHAEVRLAFAGPDGVVAERAETPPRREGNQ